MKIKCICFYTHLHENAKNRKNTTTQKKLERQKTQKTPKRKKTVYAYFQEQSRMFSRTKTQKKINTNMQILGERRQLISCEYCICVNYCMH